MKKVSSKIMVGSGMLILLKFSDLFSIGKSFCYGFVMMELFIVRWGALIYGVFFLKISYSNQRLLILIRESAFICLELF